MLASTNSVSRKVNAMNEQQKAILEALPASGEMSYEALRTKLITAGQQSALQQFHTMRRKGLVTVRLEQTDSGLVSFVSRPA